MELETSNLVDRLTVASASQWMANYPWKGRVRSCEPFKFWWAPTISLKPLISGAVNLSGRSVSRRSVWKLVTVSVTTLSHWPSTSVNLWTLPFLPRDAILARYMLSSCVRPSDHLFVCLSVTSWHCTKMAKCRIQQTTPYDSPGTLVFLRQKYRRNFNGITPNGGAK